MKSDSTVDTRKKISLLLLLLGALLALLPLSANRSFIINQNELLSEILSPEVSFSVDQVAKFIVTEDSTVRLIDLRTPEEYRKCAIPGSINIPYNIFINSDPDIYLNDKKIRNLFYGNGDYYSNYALVYARGIGYRNTYVMKGGLQEWFSTVMESKFSGSRLSPRENAVFETRINAGKLFNQMNSLPDSLKNSFLNSQKFSAKKLDGGCE